MHNEPPETAGLQSGTDLQMIFSIIHSLINKMSVCKNSLYNSPDLCLICTEMFLCSFYTPILQLSLFHNKKELLIMNNCISKKTPSDLVMNFHNSRMLFLFLICFHIFFNLVIWVINRNRRCSECDERSQPQI